MSALPQDEWCEVPEQTIPAGVFQRIDRHRGTSAMKLTILTEAMLFVVLFFGYFFLSGGDPRWLHEAPPKLRLSLLMLGVLLLSSVVLHAGETLTKKQRFGFARLAIAGTLLLGALFLVLNVFEYRDHLEHLTPWTNAYGSIFYTITTLHALHVATGMLMLLYVLILPRLEPEDEMPFRPLHNAELYWHFVDSVWIFIIAFLYVLPNLR